MSPDRIVPLTSFLDATEAHMARSALEEAGIACMLADENINTVYPLYGHLGGGIKLMVREADFETAREVLLALLQKDEQDKDDSDPTLCPECDSSNIVRRKFFGWMLLSLLCAVGLPRIMLTRRWKCRDCGNCWRE